MPRIQGLGRDKPFTSAATRLLVDNRWVAQRFVLLIICAGLGASVAAAAHASSGSDRVRFFFYNPGRTTECRFRNGVVACAVFRDKRLVILNARLAVQVGTIRSGFGSRNPACKTPPGDDAPCWFEQGGPGPVLRTGASTVDPDPRLYKCNSRAAGITCRSLLSGRGFRISAHQITTLTPRH